MSSDKPKPRKNADELEHVSGSHHKKMDLEIYEAELHTLQVELVKLQEWIKHEGLRVAVIFAVSYTHLTLPTNREV